MEREVEVIPYGIIQTCDKCQNGEMVPTGNNYYVPDIKIEHQCNNCNYKADYSDKYPLIRYRVKS